MAYWCSSQADLRGLMSVPVKDRRTNTLAPLTPRTPRSPRTPRTPGSGPLAELAALEHFVRQELARLPHDSPQRLVAFRHVFSRMIAALPAHGPLLAAVKQEYERALDEPGQASSSSMLQTAHLSTIHPLMLPASYYEARMRRAEADLELAHIQCKRLSKLVHVMRGGCIDAVRRVHEAGVPCDDGERAAVRIRAANPLPPSPPPFPRKVHPGEPVLPGELLQTVTEEMEATIDSEMQELRERLDALEARVSEAGRVAQRGQQSTTVARMAVEELVEAAVEQVKVFKAASEDGSAAKAEAADERAQALGFVLKSAFGRPQTRGFDCLWPSPCLPAWWLTASWSP